LKTRPEPFRLADGRLHCEGVDLSVLAEDLAGRPAWVLGHAALEAALARQPGTCSVAVGSIGPPAVLALLAAAGCWARTASSHELLLASSAGFPPGHVVACAPVPDDGFIKDALSVGVGLLLRPDREVALNVARIAGALDLRQPPAEGAPPEVAPDAFARCGGLLAPVLAGPPELVLDAVWERAGRAQPRVHALPDDAVAVAPHRRRRASHGSRPVRLRGLGQDAGVSARMTGLVERGDWVVVSAPDAVAVHAPHPAWPMPVAVLVREESWRVLEPRPLPAAD
jgi:hypothetical protein